MKYKRCNGTGKLATSPFKNVYVSNCLDCNGTGEVEDKGGENKIGLTKEQIDEIDRIKHTSKYLHDFIARMLAEAREEGRQEMKAEILGKLPSLEIDKDHRGEELPYWVGRNKMLSEIKQIIETCPLVKNKGGEGK